MALAVRDVLRQEKDLRAQVDEGAISVASELAEFINKDPDVDASALEGLPDLIAEIAKETAEVDGSIEAMVKALKAIEVKVAQLQADRQATDDDEEVSRHDFRV